jgi:hypothetical protein
MEFSFIVVGDHNHLHVPHLPMSVYVLFWFREWVIYWR